MSTTIKKVDAFIRRRNSGEYIIDPKASELVYTSNCPELAEFLGRPNELSLADNLSRVMFEYEGIAIKNKSIRHDAAIMCLMWIERAFACGVIKEGQGLIKKIDEVREEKKLLEQELAILSEKYLQLQEEFGEFKKRVNLKSSQEWSDKEQ